MRGGWERQGPSLVVPRGASLAPLFLHPYHCHPLLCRRGQPRTCLRGTSYTRMVLVLMRWRLLLAVVVFFLRTSSCSCSMDVRPGALLQAVQYNLFYHTPPGPSQSRVREDQEQRTAVGGRTSCCPPSRNRGWAIATCTSADETSSSITANNSGRRPRFPSTTGAAIIYQRQEEPSILLGRVPGQGRRERREVTTGMYLPIDLPVYESRWWSRAVVYVRVLPGTMTTATIREQQRVHAVDVQRQPQEHSALLPQRGVQHAIPFVRVHDGAGDPQVGRVTSSGAQRTVSVAMTVSAVPAAVHAVVFVKLRLTFVLHLYPVHALPGPTYECVSTLSYFERLGRRVGRDGAGAGQGFRVSYLSI